MANENDGNFLIISDGIALNVNMWAKDVSKTLKNLNVKPNFQNKQSGNFSSHNRPDYRESHIRHQIPNQHIHSQNQQSHHPNRGGYGSFNRGGRDQQNYGGRGGYRGGNRFDRNDNNFQQNFSYYKK